MVVSIPLKYYFESAGIGLVKVEKRVSSNEEVWCAYFSNHGEGWYP